MQISDTTGRLRQCVIYEHRGQERPGADPFQRQRITTRLASNANMSKLGERLSCKIVPDSLQP